MRSSSWRVIAAASLLLASFVLVAPPAVHAATCVASAANVGWYGGPWTGACTGTGYGGATIPGAADDVVINSGSKVVVGINSAQSPYKAAEAESVTVNGVLTMGNASNGVWGELNAGGDVVINSGGTIDTANYTAGTLTNILRYSGSFVNHGTFNPRSSGGDDVTNLIYVAPPPPDNRPNIVFILTDDQAVGETDYMANLQALMAQQGLTFKEYFVNVSLCCPSRATTLCGQYAHNTTIHSNEGSSYGGFNRFYTLGKESSTMAAWLKASSYRTGYIGKYLNGYPNSGATLYIPPGWSEWYSPNGGSPYSQVGYSMNENGTTVSYGSANNPSSYAGDVFNTKATGFINRAAGANVPFFLYVNTYSPHVADASHPAVPAARDANLFPGLTAPRTPSWNEADVSDKPAYIRNLPLLNSGQIGEIDAWYRKRIQSLQAVDKMIGDIIATLKSTGEYSNTYIFFASDNGYHMGQHRLVQGKTASYEEDMHVPLFVVGPGVAANQTRDHLAGNIDLAPTFADIAGVTPTNYATQVDGRSLLPLLGNNPPPVDGWRQALLLEHWLENTVAAAAPDPVADVRLLEPEDSLPAPRAMASLVGPYNEIWPANLPGYKGLRTAYYKYVEYTTGERELYDLRTDPYELQNAISTADPLLLSELSYRLANLAGCAGNSCRAVEDAAFGLAGLTIRRSGNDVMLTWPHMGSAVGHYQVYRSLNPYFTPGGVDSVKLLPDVPPPASGSDVSYPDPGVLNPPAASYFYAVVAVGTSGTTTIGPKHVGTFTFTLTRGISTVEESPGHATRLEPAGSGGVPIHLSPL